MTNDTPHHPFASVIVPIRDTPERLVACLEALSGQTYPQERFEILVVDNGAPVNLGTVCAHFHQVKLLHESRPGSYAARNRGLEEARGTVIAFTDADCLPRSTWLEAAVRHLTGTENSGFVGGPVELFHREGTTPSAAAIFDAFVSFPQDVDVLRNRRSVTANVVTWRHVIDAVGPFDDRLESMGDLEFTRRISDAGFRPIYGADVVVRHETRDTMHELIRKQRRVARGRYVLARRLNGAGVVEPGLGKLVRHYSTYLWTESRAILAQGAPHRRREAWISVGVNAVVKAAALLEVLRLVARDATIAPRRGRREQGSNV